jgi:hypothetical protein
LRALSYRVMGEHELSMKDYQDILRVFELQEGRRFSGFIFAMILMPTETNRRKLIKYTESFRGICELFEAEGDRTT